MSHRALALKYRPQSFEDVVGQEVSLQILKNIISQGKVHQAYLFTGPRGIGKTSLARIFAKGLNCQKEGRPDVNPCSECVSCVEITEGRSLSVYEIDGASNTSVDDVRDLREKIRYLPPGGRYKIYIIDEVHMLSTAAFNALLKTLEEPPPHALFIFATTEPQKVPVTILSRCLRFDLRPITISSIVKRLRWIAEQEKIAVEEEALFEIAREASGGLRDAISLLDQSVHLAQGLVTRAALEEIVGGSPRRFVRTIVAAILAKNPEGVIGEAKKATESGIDPKRLALDLLEQIRHLLVARVGQGKIPIDLSEEESREVMEQSQSVSETGLDHLFRILQHGLTDLLRSPVPQILLDVLLIRLCHYEELESIEKLLQRFEGQTGQTILLPTAPEPLSVEKKTPVREKKWNDFLTELKLKKPQFASLLEQAESASLKENEVLLLFPSGSVYPEMLTDKVREYPLEPLMSEFFGRSVKLKIEEVVRQAVGHPILDEAVSIFQPRTLKTVP